MNAMPKPSMYFGNCPVSHVMYILSTVSYHEQPLIMLPSRVSLEIITQ
jgi:hypothetical protein